jgi:hypothetical protein
MAATAAVGTETAYAAGDHVHPTDTSRAAASHTHTKSQITDFPMIPTPPAKTTTSPKMAATAAVGTETAYAAGDHVHPTDTSRAATSHTHTKSQITDFPTIPTVNNATLTIKQNGTSKGTFTANAATNVTIDMTIPTIRTGTQAQYDAIATKSTGTIYMIFNS